MKLSQPIKKVAYWHCAAIEQDSHWLRWCTNVLSKDEQARVARYTFEALAVHYRASRGALRYWLSQYLDVSAHQIHFVSGEFGKPALSPAHCSFNFSDSAPFWAVAVHPCTEVEIGIDIEAIERFRAYGLQIWTDILSTEEQAHWHARPPDCVYTALAKVWTRKEALLKAIGVGLHRSMRDFSVGWCSDLITIELPDIADQPARWSIHDLSPLPSGWVGALALRGVVTVHPLAFPLPIIK